MIIEKVLASAQEYLAGKTVCDLVVGISLTACALDSSEVGVSYVLRDSLPNGCSVFHYAQEAVGRPACEIAEWIVSGRDDLQRGIAATVLVAASHGLEIPDDTDDAERPFGLEVKPEDTVGMIGYIVPVAEKLGKLAGRMIVFDEGAALHGDNPMVYPTAHQAELLPECDIVILSGTTVINQSIDSLLSMCAKSREVVMVGTSTPMFPKGWAGSRVTRLAGSWWDDARKDEIFRLISRASGIRQLRDFVIMKNIKAEFTHR
jgi:uncharacterized protein (DUF4213/DUF364 family)